MKVNLKEWNAREIEDWAVSQDLAAFRGRQIRQWLFKKLALSFDEMTSLPKSLRVLLEQSASISTLKRAETQISADGTAKYLFELSDGHFIESVLIPERDHYTLCISTQAGCAIGCLFCVTGRKGLKRNLTPSEMVDQVILVKRSMDEPERLTNIVLMGMGEPLANYDAVLKALHNMVAEDGMNFSHRKVTLSTCGLERKKKN